MAKPFMCEVPLRFLGALKALVAKAESPMVAWTGNVPKVRREAERLRLEKVMKMRKMLDDLGTVGWEKACEIHGIDLSDGAKVKPLDDFE